MSFLTSLRPVLIAATLLACGGSGEPEPSDDAEGALERDRNPAQRQTGNVELTVNATDSRAAKAFIEQFVDGLREIVDLDRRDEGFDANRRDWLSSEEELADDVLKTKRNDGRIECKGNDSCTFRLERVSIVAGKPVSTGDRNYWGGTLFGKFAKVNGDAISGNYSRENVAIIGKKGTVPFIECKPGGQQPMGMGLSAETCTFHLKR